MNSANYRTVTKHPKTHKDLYLRLFSMTITELASLQLKEGKTWEDILPYIRTLLHEQADISGFPLYFFGDAHPDNIGTIYLLSGWADVSAHEHWIASDTNKRLLRDLGPLLDVKSLLHLTIEPSPKMWEQAGTVLFLQIDPEEAQKTLNTACTDGILWDDTGADAENKVEGGFRLIALNGNKIHSGLKNGQRLCTMHSRNISE